MPLSSRKHVKRRTTLTLYSDDQPIGLSGTNYNTNSSELPWYCSGNNAIHKLHTNTDQRKIIRPSTQIIYRDVKFSRANNLTILFADSSVPGLREICHSDSYFRKIVWFIAFIVLGFFALRDIHQLLSEFYSYPITVDVRLRESRKLPFPAVTVCNLNIVRYSALCNSTLNISMPLRLQEKLCGTIATSLNPKGNVSIDDINDINEIKAATDESISTPMPKAEYATSSSYPKKSRRHKRQVWKKGSKDKGLPSKNVLGKTNTPADASGDEIELTEREEKELQENLTTWLAVMANKDKKLANILGHQFEDMILRCTIKSTNCTHPMSFENSFTPTEGNCFTYKSKTLEGKRYKHFRQEETSLAGVDHGLELVLNLEVNEYLPGTAQVGALVMVHSPDDFGTSASEAIFVAPERATYIGLKMMSISRLPSPYPEHCIDHWPENSTGNLTIDATYSQQACLKICLQQTIQSRCNCQSAFLAQVDFNNTDLRICDTRRKKTRKCVEEVMLRPENKIDNCNCPPRCQVIQYEKTVSLAKWPTREDRVSFDRGSKSINFQNVAKVTVYFQTMTFQEVAQQGAWTTAKLFSSLGGFMGMYVGFSFLSLFEVFEVLSRRIWFSCVRRKIYLALFELNMSFLCGLFFDNSPYYLYIVIVYLWIMLFLLYYNVNYVLAKGGAVGAAAAAGGATAGVDWTAGGNYTEEEMVVALIVLFIIMSISLMICACQCYQKVIWELANDEWAAAKMIKKAMPPAPYNRDTSIA